ncbi:tyrosine-type recombinase/integrase [Terasakiella pusilla]|uniref:tyrosine-type recombinase/integrase n=1 Tax=Terasakiella pusilla TaxID=64973 RepID=UPI003AA84524
MTVKSKENVKITKRTVDACKPGERDVFIWDSETKGFGLKVTPAGNKIYLFQYRLPELRNAARLTIGKHGDPWTADKARMEAEKYRGDIKKGINPAALKKKRIQEAKANITVAELCDEYIEAVPFIILPKIGRPKKASSIATDKSNIERHIKPLIGKKRIGNIVRGDVERFQKDVASGKSAVDEKTGVRGRAIVKGGKGVAARATAVLKAIFSYAVKEGSMKQNPGLGVELFKGEKRTRFLTMPEMSRLGDAMIEAERNGVNATGIAAIRLLLTTGCRKDEILSLQWKWVDFEGGCLRLPDSKTDQKIVPLGAPALELLASCPRVAGNPHVLPGWKDKGHLVGLQKIWQKIRIVAELEDVRLHDFRHSFATVGVAGGDSLYLVGKVLGHKQSRTTEIYAHAQQDPLKAVADRAATQITAALDGKAGAGTVVEFKKRGE